MAATNWDNLVRDDEIGKVYRKRKIPYEETTIWETSLPEYETEHWYKSADTKKVNKTGTKKIKIRRDKPLATQFEDEVWTMFYKMGFHVMNRDDHFTIYYDPSAPSFSQQIDVFAADEDTVLVIECKTAEQPKRETFKKQIEALGGNMQKIRNTIYARPEFQNKKVKFIWATKNIILPPNDIERLNGYGIAYFNDDSVQYYTQLADHLGKAARYQLLGDIFQGTEIKSLDMRIPAIKGKMGGLDYYEFSIEPEKLLKICYVLHHSMAISGDMVTYQRIIKKSRLKEIRNFINGGGYFPNSIIISVDAKNGQLQFDPAKAEIDNNLYRIGTLHLPNKYHSAYIIDGQHRLYGYSDTDYAKTNAIPVIAFVNLDPHKQMKLFMDINENQKAVPKTLRVVLDGDLLWDSPNKNKQREALRSRIAQELGTNQTSPLYQRIRLNEDEKGTRTCCLTVAAIQSALKATHFFSTFDSAGKAVVKQGTFDKGDQKSTYELFFPFISEMLSYIADDDNCGAEWNKGQDGILCHNRGIQGIIRVISDIVDFLCSDGTINPLSGDMETLYNGVKHYLHGIVLDINGMSEKEKSDFDSTAGAGSGADTRYWRRFQQAVQKYDPSFQPAGLSEYLLNETKQFNDRARSYIDAIERALKSEVKEKLVSAYGDHWFDKGVPKKVFVDATNKSTKKNYDIENGTSVGDKTEPWDFVTLDEVHSIVTYGSNWSTLFENIMIRPEEKGKPGDKKAKTAWIQLVDSERKHMNAPNGSSYSVKKSAFDEIESVYNWLYHEE